MRARHPRSLALLTLALAATALWGVAQGRIRGTITDEKGKPVADVKITVTEPTVAMFKLETKTDAKGYYALTLLDATRTYTYRFEKEGYQPIETPLKVAIGANEVHDFRILTREAALALNAKTAPAAEPTPQQKAVLVYNEGAEASQQNDYETAKAKFVEALTLDPTLEAAASALAGVYYIQKDWTKAVEAAERALLIDPQDRRSLNVRFEAYKALGNTEKMKEASAALATADPESAARNLYNQGVQLYNAGKLAEALPLFEQAVAAFPKHGKAHYMLGLCYVNGGDTAKAKSELETFLSLAPDDSDAPSAREMLQYLK
ncbi:MAG: tetratricopeptide repeat protein [Thermoanaerobaculia bacterium]